MTIFSSLEQARRHGFLWVEYCREVRLHLVVRDFVRSDGRRVRALAFARAVERDDAEGLPGG